MKNIPFKKTMDIFYEDEEIFIEIDNKYNDKNFLQLIKENYEKYGKDFIKNIYPIYEIHLFDKKIERLILISDLVGLDSIYYYQKDNSLFFDNNIMQLANTYNIHKEINLSVLSIYFRYHYINSPETILKNIYKLKHGEYLVFQKGKLEINTYWDIVKEYNKNSKNLLKTYKDCKKELDNRLNNYIKNIVETKNDIGIYLSGGIDSSLVSALSMKYLNKPINTFSIGFYEQQYNEAEKSKKIAKYLGTNHHELYIDKTEAIETIKKVPLYYSQPFADPSALPTIILNEFAKENGIKNILTGDGADQLFCGSNIYDTIYKAQKAHRMLNPLNININPKLYKCKKKIFYIYSNSNKKYQDQCDVLYDECLFNGLFKDDNKRLESDKIKSKNWQERRMIFDIDTFCCERVLNKMGVAAKRNNISIYSPFLDKDFIEFTFKIPHKFKYYKRIKKYILKEILYDYIPKELIDKNKKGFAIPTHKWLMTYLYDDIKRLSTKSFIEKQHIFNYDKVCELLSNIHDRKYTYIIWDYYIFQIWYETYML